MDAAALRLKLRRLLESLPPKVEPAFDRAPVLRGAVFTRRYRCGKPSCHCAKGQRHAYASLALWGAGRRDVWSIAPGDAVRLRPLAARYKELRSLRAEVVRWSKAVVEILDQLEALRRMPLDRVPRGVRPDRPPDAANSEDPT